MRVIGISGKIGAGKDTLADGLCAVLPRLIGGIAVKIAFADTLKEMVCYSFGAKREHAWGTQEDKERPLPANPKYTIRDGCKILGKAYIDLDPNYFIRLAFETAETYEGITSGPLVVVMPDVRFPLEVDAVHARDGVVFRLTNALRPDDQSPSENALNAYEEGNGFDRVIDNRHLSPVETLAYAVKYLAAREWIDASKL